MKISILLCEKNDENWFSRFLQRAGRLLGFGHIEYIHAAILVDTSDLEGDSEWVYDLTGEGVCTAKFDEYSEPIGLMFSRYLDPENADDLRYIGEVIDRITFGIESDIKLDIMDLVRLGLRRPLKNHTCVSFVRFALGCERCEEIRTCEDLREELENDCTYYCGI